MENEQKATDIAITNLSKGSLKVSCNTENGGELEIRWRSSEPKTVSVGMWRNRKYIFADEMDIHELLVVSEFFQVAAETIMKEGSNGGDS